MRFSFVILHYNAISDTMECVESILRRMGNAARIVVVDNKSPNGSGLELKKKYKNCECVSVILNPENEGFARGNNVGFFYAKKYWNPDFIVMLNNDTLLLQDDFAVLVEKEYRESRFAVLGPLVETPHKPYNSNPGSDRLPSLNFFRKYRLKVRLKLILNYLHLDSSYEKCLEFFRRGKERIFDEEILKKRAENVLLHGCCWIFSSEYINRFDGLNSRTFLYQEERLLFLRLQQNGLKSVFNPDIRIFHKEDVATKTVTSDDLLRRRFMYKNYIQSVSVLLDVMKNGENS